MIGERLPATLELAFASLCVAITIRGALGVYSAIKHNSFLDHAGMSVRSHRVLVANFWLGIMLIYFLGGQLNLLPVRRAHRVRHRSQNNTRLYLLDSLITGNFPAFWSALQHLLMPAFTLGSALAAIVTRISRSSVLEVHAPGLRHNSAGERLERKNRDLRHILRNALITIVTILGFSGRVAERFGHHRDRIFLSGIGDLLIQSISARDYKLTQVLILMFAVTYFVVNLLVDLLYKLDRSRIRF